MCHINFGSRNCLLMKIASWLLLRALLLLPTAQAVRKRAGSDSSSRSTRSRSPRRPEAPPVLPENQHLCHQTHLLPEGQQAPPAAPPTQPPVSLTWNTFPAAPPIVPASATEAIGSARAVRSACNHSASNAGTSSRDLAPVAKVRPVVAKSQASPVAKSQAAPVAKSQAPPVPKSQWRAQAASIRQAWPTSTNVRAVIPPHPDGVIPSIEHIIRTDNVNPLAALVAGLETYMRVLLARQDIERARLAGVQADLQSIQNAIQRQRTLQHNQHVDVMQRLSRCRLMQIGFGCTNACHQAATMPTNPTTVRPPAQPPPAQRPPGNPTAVRPAAQRPRGTVANQCPIWYPQSCSSSSSSSAAIADDGPPWTAAAAAAARHLTEEYWRMQSQHTQLFPHYQQLREANATAAPPALPAALVAELTAAEITIDPPLLAALPAVLPTHPVTEDPELEPEPGAEP